MKYEEYQPARPLRAVINCFWSIEQDPEDLPSGAWDRTVPDGSLELVLHLAEPMIRKPLHGAPAPESRCVLIGQMTEPYLVGADGPARMLGVRFFPHTGYRFFDGFRLRGSTTGPWIWTRSCRVVHACRLNA